MNDDQNTNQWSNLFGFITWGLILTTLQLNFLYLQYVLPTIGVLLIFLGFRSLRNENKYFKTVWILSIVKLILQLTYLALVSTPLYIEYYPERALGTAMLAFQIAIFLIFHVALKETYKKAGKLIEGAPLLWASLWAVVAYLIGLSSMTNSWLVLIPMVICYISIIRSLYSIGSKLNDEGYVKDAPVRINSRIFGSLYLLIALAIAIIFGTYYNHLKLEPQEYHLPKTIESRQRLLDMEFPAEALKYLSDEDVAMLSGAMNVEVFSELLMFDPYDYGPSKKNMEATTIYIEMPENVLYVVQYFSWKNGQPVWQDAILMPGDIKEDNKQIISSGLFYSKKGIEYTANFPRLVLEELTKDTMFLIDYPLRISGALSYPFGSEGQGGYVLYRYTVLAESEAYFIETIFSYLHISSPLIPYAKTEDQILNGEYTSADRMQQHYTIYNSLRSRERNR